ncbi:signal peptidase I [Smithella sp. SCADC]|jgi:signal peptidase I|nr:signal peptidase I [Smithella sp. SCADC]HAR49013.1 signal peptidase I [Smithella sp.]
MAENNKTKEKRKSKVKEYVESIIIAILIALFIRTFIICAYKIPSRSMVPTLLVGDHILVNKFLYGIKIPLLRKTIVPVSNPQRGDIVVFIYPNDRSKDFIKRVIGVAGDKIEIKNKKIFINDKEYKDSYGIYSDNVIYPASIQPRDNFGPVTVPQKSIFVMGDNRDESLDSRFWGFVNLKDVEGKAFIIYWSWNREDHNLRWQRLGNLLH